MAQRIFEGELKPTLKQSLRKIMEIWFVVLSSICVCAIIRSLMQFFSYDQQKLPPGPPAINLVALRQSFSDIVPFLHSIFPKYGPIVSLFTGSCRSIFVACPRLAHEALVRNGSIFADRPSGVTITSILNDGRKNINSSLYGPTWRILRRNLASQILNQSRICSHATARSRALDILINRLNANSQQGQPVEIIDHVTYAMYFLFVLMCFGEELPEEKVNDIIELQQKFSQHVSIFGGASFSPKLVRFLFPYKWREVAEMRKLRGDVFVQLIRSRAEKVRTQEEKSLSRCYLDSLMNLHLPEENRILDDGDIVCLCTEFVVAGTGTTSTAVEWIMANLVKKPQIQERIFDEIKELMNGSDEHMRVGEEYLGNLRYLKATVLEALRRHPPVSLLLAHAVTEETKLGGYTVPKNAAINFAVSEMGMDPGVWEEPMEFVPERFLTGNGGEVGEDVFDVTGSREIKMMPFGAGRRICPGYALALHHLHFFVANLVWVFQWKPDGDVDLSERHLLITRMKKPLKAHLSGRASGRA